VQSTALSKERGGKMFFLYLALIVAIPSAFVLVWSLYRDYKHDRYDSSLFPASVFFLFVAVVILVIAPFKTMFSYTFQIYDQQELIKIEECRVVYQQRADVLVKEFAGYLSVMYPEHERDIFNTISPKDVDVYFAKYPDLRSSETIVALVREISALRNAVYTQDILRAETLKNMRVRKVTPWNVRRFIPDIKEQPEGVSTAN
jgi:hypothetical protein